MLIMYKTNKEMKNKLAKLEIMLYIKATKTIK